MSFCAYISPFVAFSFASPFAMDNSVEKKPDGSISANEAPAFLSGKSSPVLERSCLNVDCQDQYVSLELESAQLEVEAAEAMRRAAEAKRRAAAALRDGGVIRIGEEVVGAIADENVRVRLPMLGKEILPPSKLCGGCEPNTSPQDQLPLKDYG